MSKIIKSKINQKLKLGIIGLGYVGLPLLLEFAKKRKVIGYDINENRIRELNDGIDCSNEFTYSEIKNNSNIIFTNNIDDLKAINFFIVTVPTPVDKNNKPDMTALISACTAIGNFLKINDFVVFESTVYPGATEEICVPVLEKQSGLKLNKEFYCGYSPERINPGDKKFTISNIVKITSGSNTYACKIIDNIYKEIITAGTYKVESIKVAEAAKVIENTQRDLNIALVNELSIIFNKMNIDTKQVLDAASTKWNFMPFQPGLVGGHCIGVDPYYLTTKAIEIGHHPEVILAGRKINDGMAIYVADQLIKSFLENNIKINNARVLIMGLTFKENCSDIRNSKVFDLIFKLKKLNLKVEIYDPLVDFDKIKNLSDYKTFNQFENINSKFDAIVITVAHNYFKKMDLKNIMRLCKPKRIIFDLKRVLPSKFSNLKL